ncbi:hypothetical protein K435DRAFT_645352, partial [Dendrothele bispora CBS 962.96]
KPAFTSPLGDQITVADKALEKAMDSFDQDTAQFPGTCATDFALSGTIFYEMARFDFLTNRTQFYEILKNAFPIMEKGTPNFASPFIYGYAALQAYSAYKDDSFLEIAKANWEYGWANTISKDSAASGQTPVKIFGLCRSSKSDLLHHLLANQF